MLALICGTLTLPSNAKYFYFFDNGIFIKHFDDLYVRFGALSLTLRFVKEILIQLKIVFGKKCIDPKPKFDKIINNRLQVRIRDGKITIYRKVSDHKLNINI